MAAVATQPPTGHNSSRSSSVVNGNAAVDFINGHGPLPDSPASATAPASQPAVPLSKKSKGKKAVDPNETGKLLAAKINQLELDAAGEKDHELEIGESPLLRTLDDTHVIASLYSGPSISSFWTSHVYICFETRKLTRAFEKNRT